MVGTSRQHFSSNPSRRGRSSAGLVMFLTLLLLGAAFYVRSLPATQLTAPHEDDDLERPSIAEPMQLLGRGGEARLDELSEYISSECRVAWEAHSGLPFQLFGCPSTRDFLSNSRGQPVERLIADLTRGTREEALAALTLLFQMGRASHWRPGMFGGEASDAEKMGAMLEAWIARWAEPGMEDKLLFQPTLAALVVYGRVMRAARNAPAFGTNAAAEERARAFLNRVCGLLQSQRTALGDALQSEHPRAFSALFKEEDFLLGLHEEALSLFPEIDGSCSSEVR